MATETRGPVHGVPIAIWVWADTQQEPDGTWTAVCWLGGRQFGPVSGETEREALIEVSRKYSVHIGGES
jgi:hypothetical protein